MQHAVIQGDCLAVMPTLDADSVDAIVCDPPYGLSFMGRDWDHGIPGVAFWEAALRVAKPGAHLVAFGGTRTFHRLACAIEDAGWEIRDTLMWVYGSGFPKSLDVSKAMDKAAGAERGHNLDRRNGPNTVPATKGDKYSGGYDNALRPDTGPATDLAKQWAGWGTALKPAWEPIILARKPLRGTVAATVAAYGTGGLNVDGCRVNPGMPYYAENAPSRQKVYANPIFDGQTGHGPKAFTKNDGGRWPANVVLSHSPDCRTNLEENTWTTRNVQCADTSTSDQMNVPTAVSSAHSASRPSPTAAPRDPASVEPRRKTAGECAPSWPVALLDAQSGERRSAGRYPSECGSKSEGWGNIGTKQGPLYADHGGASRFFATFKADEVCGMQLVYQTRPGWPDGNCLMASVATVLGVTLEECPDLGTATLEGDNYWQVLQGFVRRHGLEAVWIGAGSGAPRGYSVVSVMQPNGTAHACVAIEGNIVHNPTRGAPLEFPHTVTGYIAFIPLAEPEASRMFYCAKASRREREAGLGDLKATHPTVKPLALMDWLTRLVCPPGGLVLDPFCGSGSTGCSAIRQGFRFLGIEREAEYVAIAERRIAHWTPVQPDLEPAA